MPSLFFFGLGDLNRRLLNTYRKTTLPMISTMLAVSMHPFWCHYLAVEMKMNIIGIAFALTITHGINYFLMIFFTLKDNQLK